MNYQNGQNICRTVEFKFTNAIASKIPHDVFEYFIKKYSKMTTFSKSFKNFIQNFSINFSITNKNA